MCNGGPADLLASRFMPVVRIVFPMISAKYLHGSLSRPVGLGTVAITQSCDTTPGPFTRHSGAVDQISLYLGYRKN